MRHNLFCEKNNNMTIGQILAKQRADLVVAKFIEEILGSGHIKGIPLMRLETLLWKVLSKILMLHLLQNERNQERIGRLLKTRF